MKNIKPGSIIKGYYWPEPIEVKIFEDLGEYVHIVGSTTVSREHLDQIIPKGEFQTLGVQEMELNFSEDPSKVFLSLEAKRYRFASIIEPS